MGACEFYEYIDGDQTLDDAFAYAREDAAYMSGHGGYTGTVAEKNSVVAMSKTPQTYQDAMANAYDFVESNNPKCAEKWGPGGAIRVRDETHNGWLLFGMASS